MCSIVEDGDEMIFLRASFELTILFLSLIGGVWGTIAGMFLFRHKTAKPGFQAVIILIVLLNFALLYYLLA